LIDKWMLSRLNSLVSEVTTLLENFDIHLPTRALERFVEELSNWYVRRNRRRFWKAENDSDKQAAYLTLSTCLKTLALLLAPFLPYVSEALYQNLVAGSDASAPESAHLAPWPETATSFVDEQLLDDMAVLLEAASLGRSVRQAAGLRVRQPLSEMLVRATKKSEGLRRFESELREELNVKRLRFLSVDEGLVEYHFKPNLPVVDKRYGRLIPAIRAALASLTGERATAAARTLEKGEAIELAVDGQVLHLEPDEVLIQASSPQGYAVAEGNGLLIALKTTVTAELQREGTARDLVRLIQDARKGADLEITDRIDVTLQPEGIDLVPVLAEYEAYIRAETLAHSLRLASPAQGASTTTVELERGSVTIGLSRSTSRLT
jgi:isoleucyl-tRNA synthetase